MVKHTGRSGSLTMLEMIERVLDSPHECDKWRTELESFYLRHGGQQEELTSKVMRTRTRAAGLPDGTYGIVREVSELLQDSYLHTKEREATHTDAGRGFSAALENEAASRIQKVLAQLPNENESFTPLEGR